MWLEKGDGGGGGGGGGVICVCEGGTARSYMKGVGGVSVHVCKQ